MKRQLMLHIAAPAIFILSFLSCGIEEFFYLPQPDQGDRLDVNSATIYLRPISDIYYAMGYTIYYRIYLSPSLVSSTIPHTRGDDDTRILINRTLDSDVRALFPFTDIAIDTSIATTHTFTSRNFHELEVFTGLSTTVPVSNVLTTNGGNLSVLFPTFSGSPTLTINGIEYELYRAQGDSFFPKPEVPAEQYRRFFSTPELNSNANAISTVNADVARHGTGTDDIFAHAYVAMYIAAVGQNPENFSKLISNPTLISIFKLPNAN